MRSAASYAHMMTITDQPVLKMIEQVQQETKAACRAAVEKQLIHGALSLRGKTAVEQADAVLAAIDGMKVR